MAPTLSATRPEMAPSVLKRRNSTATLKVYSTQLNNYNNFRICWLFYFYTFTSTKINSFFRIFSSLGKYGYVDEFGVLQVLGKLSDPYWVA